MIAAIALLMVAVNEGRGEVRTYYVAAEEVVWDYAPRGGDLLEMGIASHAPVFLESRADRIGSRYLKAVYREYKSREFEETKPRPEKWEHAGILGPVLRGEVGDSLRIVFKNRTCLPLSMHPHGVFYDKASEGAGYADNTSGQEQEDDSVAPGKTHTYHWGIPEQAGPGPQDPSSIPWLYHSHVNTPRDTNTGLVGPILVTRRGMARADGSPKDVDREFITLFTIFDENVSRFREQNLERFVRDPDALEPDDPEFEESNLLHSINGYVYGNLPMMTMREGETVRWYLLALGNEVDLHTAHWHGQTALHAGRRTDTIELLPASMKVADMQADNPGVWLYHCHVNDHITAGMVGRFEILPAE